MDLPSTASVSLSCHLSADVVHVQFEILPFNASSTCRSNVPEEDHSRAETKDWALSPSGEVGTFPSCVQFLYSLYILIQLHVVKLPSPAAIQASVVNSFRVFVLADPDVFSGSLVQFLSDNIETSSSLSTSDHMRSMVQHSIQATLGGDCHGPKLAQGLQVSGTVQCCFKICLAAEPLQTFTWKKQECMSSEMRFLIESPLLICTCHV